MYRLVGFTGTPALLLKLLIIGIVDFVGGFAIISALNVGSTVIAGVLLAILLFINWVYLFKSPTPFKFLAPGIVFLCVFVLVPIVYTVAMSGFNFRTGNEISKEQAIEQIQIVSLSEDAEGTAFDMAIGKDAAGNYAALLKNQINGEVLLATLDGVTILEEGTYEVDEFEVPIAADGFSRLTNKELNQLGDGIVDLRFPYLGDSFVSPLYDGLAVLLTQDLIYNADDDTFVSKSTGAIYADNGNGNYANTEKRKDVLYPGWRNVNFPDNFTGLIFDPELRGPFIRVLIWTVAFAFLSVLTTFSLGLALAIAMDKPIRGRRIYRSILILPYAIPGFLSLLIWRGMFNQDFGIINRILVDIGLIETNIAWFDQAWTARIMVILVNLWLGFPYMYLISSGALQAIPSDLKEAAAIDGASSAQSFRLITLPLLLQILFPLLIASFAFNFNNFNMIYLLTGGGPRDELAGERAGATDILISYAYNTAISNPADQNFGLASAISLFMFIIVGILSLWSLRRTKALEEF
jgi:arabinogalactan oligomer/maltooligosaccharide transport system permease protein